MPFVAPERDNSSRWRRISTVDLRQVGEDRRGRTEFEVLAEFGYTTAGPEATDAAGEYWQPMAVDYLVPRNVKTDLATVPTILWGVVASYGRQTLPAIIHDQLCVVSREGGPPSAFTHRARREADQVFLETLAQSGTGPVRRWLMWTGVRFGGHPVVLALFGALLVAVPVALLVASTLAILVLGIVLLAFLVGVVMAGVERGRAPVGASGGAGSGGGSGPAGGAAGRAEFTRSRVEPRGVGSLLGAAVIGAVAAPLLLPVALLTWFTALVVGLGESRALVPSGVGGVSVAGAGAAPGVAHGGAATAGPTARIRWAPLLGAGDSTVNGNPDDDDL